MESIVQDWDYGRDIELQDMAAVVIGTLKLFDKFVLVDFEKNTYQYVSGTYPQMEKIPCTGSYEVFVDYMCSLIIEDEDKNKLGKYLKKDNIIKNMDEETLYLRYECYINRGQPRWENLNIICLERKGGQLSKVLFTKQDVTEVKEEQMRQQKALMEACQAAEAANHAKNVFLSRMSHDIRTPLNAITGMTTIAMMHSKENEKLKSCLQKITISSRHLLHLVNEVLDMSQIESGAVSLEEEKFSLSRFAESIAVMVETQMKEKKQTLHVSLEGIRHDMVIGDGERLQQVILNILSNAIKFTGEEGKISFMIYELMSNNINALEYRFVVEDNGIGMDMETTNHLFEPFYRGKDAEMNKIDGSGLGLSIVRSILYQMQGDIIVQSVKGLGSRFVVTVCMKGVNDGEDYNLDGIKQKEKKHKSFNGKRVLIVEDNKYNMEIISEMLSSMGIETDQAFNGKQALKIIKEKKAGNYDLILMDIQLPELDGYQTAMKIRESGRLDLEKIPIIATTAYAFKNDVKKALKSGMNAHMAKPIEIDTLTEVLEEWL